MKNYYTVLGIDQFASDKEIKQAYRTMAVIYHPDKNQDNPFAEDKFKEINEAYQILSDTTKKAQFDLILNYNLANKNRKQYSYNPNERSSNRYNPPPKSRHYKPREPKLTFEDSIRNLSEKNFFRIGFITVFIISTIIGIAEFISFQRSLKVQELAEKKRVFTNETITYTTKSILDGDFEVALNNIESAQKKYPSEYFFTSLKSDTQDSLKGRADFYYNNRLYLKALSDYTLLLKHQAYNGGNTSLMYGKCLTNLKREKEAIIHFENAAKKWKYSPQINYELAKLEVNSGKISLANKHITEAELMLKKYYQNSYGKFYYFNANRDNIPFYHYEVYMLFGDIKQLINNSKEALRAYSWAEFLQPNLPQPLVSQAEILSTSGKKDEACSLYKQAIEKGYSAQNIIDCNL